MNCKKHQKNKRRIQKDILILDSFKKEIWKAQKSSGIVLLKLKVFNVKKYKKITVLMLLDKAY